MFFGIRSCGVRGCALSLILEILDLHENLADSTPASALKNIDMVLGAVEYKVVILGLYHKTYYGCNLRISIIS